MPDKPWELTDEDKKEAHILARRNAQNRGEQYFGAYPEIECATRRKLVGWVRDNCFEEYDSMRILNDKWYELCEDLGVKP
jgi:hypothetical protein